MTRNCLKRNDQKLLFTEAETVVYRTRNCLKRNDQKLLFTEPETVVHTTRI
ncbi:hypothetical protein HanHA300_Chr08g0263651 [Helianthus annuus]|nr:hypothetical protein HanHA300_Chr08g0263651 [Helianthus annuus]